MSELSKVFEDFGNELLLRVNTLAPAVVLKYDSVTKRADIQPLFYISDKDGNLYKQSPINDALVLDHCTDIEMFENHTCIDSYCNCDDVLKQYAEWRKLKKGDVVFYIPAQRSLENFDDANFIDPDSHKLMSSNDAVVVGRFTT